MALCIKNKGEIFIENQESIEPTQLENDNGLTPEEGMLDVHLKIAPKAEIAKGDNSELIINLNANSAESKWYQYIQWDQEPVKSYYKPNIHKFVRPESRVASKSPGLQGRILLKISTCVHNINLYNIS